MSVSQNVAYILGVGKLINEPMNMPAIGMKEEHFLHVCYVLERKKDPDFLRQQATCLRTSPPICV